MKKETVIDHKEPCHKCFDCKNFVCEPFNWRCKVDGTPTSLFNGKNCKNYEFFGGKKK